MKTALRLSIILLAVLFIFAAGCEKKKKPNKTILKISSVPEKALITIDGHEMGEAPFPVEISPGKHIVQATKDGCFPKLVKVLCSPEVTTPLEISLDPFTASVLIESVPQGAEVVIKGESIGETPLVLYNQNTGTHTAILKKIGSVSREITWEVTDEKPRYVKEKLSSNLGTLTIRTEPSNATITVDDKQAGNTPYSASLPEGNHKIKLSLTGHADYEQTIMVLRDKSIVRNVDLQLLPGSVTITSTPPGSFVYVNDKQYDNTPCEIKNLSPGTYKLKIQRPGYDAAERDFSIRPGQKTSVAINLDSNTGRIQFVTCPAGVSVYLDGQLIGKTEMGEIKDVSKVFEINNVSMGSHILTLAHKLARPNKKSVSLKIGKGETKRLKNIKMWVADTELLLKDGNRHVGRLALEDKDSIMFEIEPGVTQHYEKAEIKSMKPIEYKEE